MAWNLSRIPTTLPRIISLSILAKSLPQFYSKLEVDVIDDFTSQLMQQKMGKWDHQKRKNEALVENVSRSGEKQFDEVKIGELGTDQLGILFQNAIDADNGESVIDLIKFCVDRNETPPLAVLMNVLSFCSQNGNKDAIQQIHQLCENRHPDLLVAHSNFRHFVAEAVWVRGDVSKAVEIFEGVYRENAFLRRRIRLILKYLMTDLVSSGSEAALGNTMHFAERLFRDFNDLSPLTYVWQTCFLSEWFTDQCVALELLEKHNGLFKAVINRIPYVVFVSLKCHRTEVVYRLLEILLKYKMKQQYSSVVASLLNYQFRRGDLIRCSEIIRWAVDNDVPLPKNHHIKMINLLLNRKMNTPLAPQEKEDHKPRYDLKF
jgi:hypothetical protein